MDTEYVQKGKYLEHPADLHTNALVDGEVVAVPLVYVPYETLPDGYRDTFTGGAKKEDLQNSYLRMDIERLGKTVEDVKNFGTHGLGEFDLVYLDGDESKPAKLLPTSFSAALDALMQKNADRGVKGKDTYKPELYQ